MPIPIEKDYFHIAILAGEAPGQNNIIQGRIAI
jgi:hypothetical protein